MNTSKTQGLDAAITSPFLTLREAARYMRMETLSRFDEMIGRYVRDGRLKGVKRGNKYLFKREWLDRFLENSVRGA